MCKNHIYIDRYFFTKERLIVILCNTYVYLTYIFCIFDTFLLGMSFVNNLNAANLTIIFLSTNNETDNLSNMLCLTKQRVLLSKYINFTCIQYKQFDFETEHWWLSGISWSYKKIKKRIVSESMHNFFFFRTYKGQYWSREGGIFWQTGDNLPVI